MSRTGEDELKDRAEPAYGGAHAGDEATRLMLRVQADDPQAFEALAEGVRGGAYRLARSLVGSPDDALELVQEALLKVWRARASFRAGERFEPWFHRILRNACISHLRKQRRLRSLSAPPPGADEDEGDFEIADLAQEPSEAALRGERAQAFWRAFRTLSSRDREMLALRHFQELSYKEIATTLDVPEGTVMSRLFHARKRLRAALPDELFAGFLGSIGAGQADATEVGP